MNTDTPYYGRHKVTELTCPHCHSMLTFLINEDQHAIYSCQCGRWFKEIVLAHISSMTDQDKWRYEPLEEYQT